MRDESIRDTKQAFSVQISNNEGSNNEGSNDVLLSDSPASKEELMILFTKYPDLKSRLHAIYSVTLEPPLTGVGESYEKDFSKPRFKNPWTQERADQRALQALHHALTKKDGEGIREFAQLVNITQFDRNQ